MARVKDTIFQRNFSFGVLREDFLEADDLDIRQSSLKDGGNMRVLATRALENRPGLVFERALDLTAQNIVEIRPTSDLLHGLVIRDHGAIIIDQNGDLVQTIDNAPWPSGAEVWVESFGEDTFIGGVFGINELTYSNGTYSLTDFAFAAGTGNSVSQPYWVFAKGSTIQPTARTDDIDIIADGITWTDGYVGLRVRYNRQEILITEIVSSTVARGTCIQTLPPSFDVVVSSAVEFREGEAVVGADTNFQGVVSSIDGNTLSVTTLEFFDGPDVGELLSGTTASSQVTSKTEISPLPSNVWDEPLMSDVRGWPRAASAAAGRLILLDFAQAEDAIALSSARDLRDFQVGADDDDAIARSLGDNKPRWRHAVNLEDLLLFADNGVYYVPLRDNAAITPSTFNALRIDETGSSSIRPVKVEDGVVFIESGGEGVSAALLDGNVRLKWSVRSMSEYHNQLIKTPVNLCGPATQNSTTEKYVFVINSDGTLAVLSWIEDLRNEAIGFMPWTTQGVFKAVAPMFGQYWAIVERQANGADALFLERFSTDAYVDCSVGSIGAAAQFVFEVNGQAMQLNSDDMQVVTAAPHPLVGETVAVYADGWDVGDFVVQSDGSIEDLPEFDRFGEVGLVFESHAAPWPMENVESTRFGLLKARVLQLVVSVQDTLGFSAQCNRYSATIGAYMIGADLTEPPVPRTQRYRFSVFGNKDHPELEVRRKRPGPFRILALGQRVQA